MGAMAVVVTGVTTKDTLEMGFVHDEEVVEALRSDRAIEPLCKCIRVRAPEGRLQDLSSHGLEYFVEARHVLGVTIADQELGSDMWHRCGYSAVGHVLNVRFQPLVSP
jgi:hypothetical protein